ncbi:MAG: CRISPR-associated endonuclease Cas1 [Nitrosomonas sp.]|uniref:CRISPR-associated endonuclease Cas1 n=1 Tax=Nitrosomonas sp. TaxID=42353 RepID=UPI0027357ACF|nr:CRISPR-associated endonuclease Cas1 [Nitrosomonas sp.]MDP3281505.1 CRISPR-associated endonuclease Cas1 [Nitrosomonas sp.]
MSRVIGPLLRKALTLSMLHRAWEKVADNNGMAGIDGESIAALTPQINAVLHQLAKDVVSGDYLPQGLMRLWVERPDKPPRGLAVPTVRDRILQTSLTLALTPKVEAELEDCSYAYRKGRGVRLAVERIGFYQRQGYHWIVDADIEAFFDTIPHAGLLAHLQTIAPEPALIQLVAQWLIAPIQDGGQLTFPHQGIAQGSPISPMLANLYLDTLDEALLDADHVLIRYADDFIVLAKSKKRAEAALELTKDVLDRLTLKLNPLKTRIVHFDEGLEFLGWYFVHSLAIPKRWQEMSSKIPRLPATPPPDAVAHAAVDPTQNQTGFIPGQPPLVSAPDQAEPALGENADIQETDGFEAELPPLAPLQRTLYLVDHRTRLTVENQRYQIIRDDAILLSLPAHHVDQIMLFGSIQVTTQALQLAARNECSISYLSLYGRYYGRFDPANGQNVTLLQAQFSCHADASFQLDIARSIVSAKLHNCRVILARSQRHHQSAALVPTTRQRLKQIEQSLKTAASMESLRGSEGAAAALYWQAFAGLIPSPWQFGKRQARPAPDPVNALLSLGYTLLYQAAAGLLQARSLNAHLGMLHSPGGTHLALASGLMEVFRAYIVDATVLKLLHTQQLDPKAYTIQAGTCSLGNETVRIFIRALEDRFNGVQQHPQTGFKMDFRRIIDHDILSLIKACRSHDAVCYQATRWR